MLNEDIMKKMNAYEFAMLQKYGPEWNAPLFNQDKVIKQIPKEIDDATESKAEVYQNLRTEEQREIVLNAFRQLKQGTDNEVARILKVVPSTISARRNELINRGLIVPVLDEHGNKMKKKDPITGEPNVIWRPIQPR